MNKQNPFSTMKIRRWSYSLMSAGILLLSVSHPVVAQISPQYWEEQDRRRAQEEEEWYWHDRMMRQREQERQQQPVRSAEERAKRCSDQLRQLFYKADLSGIVSAQCTAMIKGDYNTAWINTRRIAAIYYAKNYISEAEVKEFLDTIAANMINNYGWTPPEYR